MGARASTRERLARASSVIEIPHRVRSRTKLQLSQNRPAADRAGVIASAFDGARHGQRRGARAAGGRADGTAAAPRAARRRRANLTTMIGRRNALVASGGFNAARSTSSARAGRGPVVRASSVCVVRPARSAAQAPSARRSEPQSLLTVDHYVAESSTVPAIAGQTTQIYVRERVQAGDGAARRAPRDDRVVLFVHGAGTPAEVAFDVPYADYSWMAYPRRRRLRRVLDGHDGLRPLDAAER